jgi:hypothetical protein
MEFGSFEEFWAALTRLYDSLLESKARIDRTDETAERLGNNVERLGDTVDTLAEATTNLLHATEKLHSVAETHERRLHRAEITIEAILEDLRRHRQAGAQ